eukprot:4920009-Alexandrium_andersonii.AAC.1
MLSECIPRVSVLSACESLGSSKFARPQSARPFPFRAGRLASTSLSLAAASKLTNVGFSCWAGWPI